jgi:hypothetical protein
MPSSTRVAASGARNLAAGSAAGPAARDAPGRSDPYAGVRVATIGVPPPPARTSPDRACDSRGIHRSPSAFSGRSRFDGGAGAGGTLSAFREPRTTRESDMTRSTTGEMDAAIWTEIEWMAVDAFEIGSLVASLSAWTEDEVELDDWIRHVVEAGPYRICVGGEPKPCPVGN